jgi:biotin carboxyl carrier protein
MSAIQLKSGERIETVEILERTGNKFRILLGEKQYTLDAVKVEKNIFSILLGNKSFNIEVVPTGKKNTYTVKNNSNTFTVTVIDAETRYLQNRLKAAGDDGINIISSPMPGKIVRVMVKAGDKVEAGQVVITVSAMKMESEYKSGKNGIVKEVMVSEGDIVDANVPLIVLE